VVVAVAIAAAGAFIAFGSYVQSARLASVVLAGGGAKLGGFLALAERSLSLPVRMAEPRGLGKMTDTLRDPAYAAVVGLIAYGNRLRLMRESQEKTWTGRLWGALRGKSTAS
jgi:cell division ATPase FtsA